MQFCTGFPVEIGLLEQQRADALGGEKQAADREREAPVATRPSVAQPNSPDVGRADQGDAVVQRAELDDQPTAP